MKHFNTRLLFLTIPKPLKPYTLFKKKYPFRSLSPSYRLYESEADLKVEAKALGAGG
jgi:hypothetical protein